MPDTGAHVDLPSLEKLGKKIPIVLPRGLGGLLRRRRFESVVAIERGEGLRIGERAIPAFFAEHDGSRDRAAPRRRRWLRRHRLWVGLLRGRHRSLPRECPASAPWSVRVLRPGETAGL